MINERFWEFYDEENGFQRVLKPLYPSDEELLRIFPEAVQIINTKLLEWQEVKEELLQNEVKPRMGEISKYPDEFTRVFSKQVLQAAVSGRLDKINGHIVRLERLQIISDQINGKKSISSAQFTAALEKARNVPILQIAEAFIELKKISSKRFRGLCPFHQEKTPSFIVFTETNSWFCFGCHEGGDLIKLVSKFYKLDFNKTLNFLNRQGDGDEYDSKKVRGGS